MLGARLRPRIDPETRCRRHFTRTAPARRRAMDHRQRSPQEESTCPRIEDGAAVIKKSAQAAEGSAGGQEDLKSRA